MQWRPTRVHPLGARKASGGGGIVRFHAVGNGSFDVPATVTTWSAPWVVRGFATNVCSHPGFWGLLLCDLGLVADFPEIAPLRVGGLG